MLLFNCVRRILTFFVVSIYETVKTSALQQGDIVNGLRVLYLKDGLFFEGTVNELMPPDVYVMYPIHAITHLSCPDYPLARTR